MNCLNSILAEGNLVRDPVSRVTPTGTPITTFTIGSNRYYKKDPQDSELQKESSFFEVESWGRLATACAENLHKGRGVRIVGRLKQDRWTTPDGKPMQKIKIVAEHVEFKPVLKTKPVEYPEWNPDEGTPGDDMSAEAEDTGKSVGAKLADLVEAM